MSKADELIRTMNGALRETASHRPPPAAMPTLSIASAVGGERTKGTVRSKTSLDIGVERIEADPNQPREIFDEDAHRRLTESIRRRGVRMRIAVRWSEDSGKYLVVAGERRLRAAKAASLATVPCDVIEDGLSETDVLVLQGIENLIRDDLKPIEQAKLFRTLLAANNWTQQDLSDEFGISQPTISQTLSLLDLPKPVQALVDDGKLATTVASELAAKIEDPAEQEELAERFAADKTNRSEAKAIVAERKAAGNPKSSGKGRGATVKSKANSKLLTERSIKTDSGFKVVVAHRKGFDVLALVEALRDATAKAEAMLPAGVEAAD